MTKPAFGFPLAPSVLTQWGQRVTFSWSPTLTSHEDIATVLILEEAPPFDWFVPETYLALEDREAVAEGLSVVGLVIAPPAAAPPMDWYVNDRDPAAEAEPSPVPQLGFIEMPITPAPITTVAPPVSTQAV